VAATILLAPIPGFAQVEGAWTTTQPLVERPKPRLIAVRTSEAPEIDGDLRDAAWTRAVPTTAFTQKFPGEAQAPSESTELRVLYDDSSLYVAFNCIQTGVAVKGRLARRDRKVESDWVTVAIDDGASTYEFSVNAAGVLGDGVRFNDTDYSGDWDGVWDGQARQGPGGWAAELRIPLRIFQHAAGVQDWGFQARRYISERQETAEWSFIPRAQAGEVSHYGRLAGIGNIQRTNPIELLPYATAGVDWADTTVRGSAFGDLGYDIGAGLDLRWRLGKKLTLDAAFNPDFAQVEADQLLLNLTTFETFSPEKRPFFINGMKLFQTPRVEVFPSANTMFYTRRIGSVPGVPVLNAADPANAAGDAAVGALRPSTIYAAAKLGGQLTDGINASAVSALTGRSDATVTPQTGATQERLAAPMALANVARVRADVGSGGAVGVLATALDRFEPDDGYPTVMSPGGEQMRLCPDGSSRRAGARCFHDAYAAGVDGVWRSPSGTYVVAGQGIVTAIENGPPRTMPDGTVIQSGDVDDMARLYIAKQGGQWLGSVEFERIGRRTDFNDLGFLQRQNQVRFVPYLEYRTLTPFWEFAELSGHAFMSLRDNLGGVDLLHGYYLGGEARFKNFWTMAAEGYVYTSRFEDRDVGDGTALQRPGVHGGDVSFSTDPRRELAVSIATETFLFSTGGKSFRLNGAVTYQPLTRLELQLLPQLVDSTRDPRYVSGDRESGTYLFGQLAARSVGATLRTSYTFTNRLTLQLYGQLLLVAKHYSRFASFSVDPEAPRPVIHLDELTPAPAPATNPDSAETNLNLSAVLRWEFRPGSTLFLVYSRFQAPELALDGKPAELDLGALRNGPATDSLRLKVSYYWN
jgi:hypothetical protein